MAIGIKDVLDLDLADEFADVKRSKIQAAIVKARCFVDASAYGDKADTATAHLAAHFLASGLAGSGGVAGPVVSETAGMLSHTFAQPNRPKASASGGSFGSTTFGQCFLELRSTLALTPLTAWGLDCA